MIKLYDHPLSPYSQKVKIALIEKGIEFEAQLPTGIGSGQAEGEFVEANPRAEVPTLIHDHVQVFDSTIILEYIEDTWPEPSLLPGSAAGRAHVRMLEDAMDTHYEPINWGLSEIANFGRATGDLADEMNRRAQEQIGRWHGWLEKQLGDRNWFNGDHFGWGDLSVIPYINGSAGFGITPPDGSKLAAWRSRVNERDSVKQVSGAAAEVARGDGGGMAQVKEALEQGLFKREYRDHRLEWMIKTGGLSVVIEGLEKDNIRFTPDFS